MNNSIQEILLGDRIQVGTVSNRYAEGIQERLRCGYSDFELDGEKIKPVFCSSINKHTCLSTISSRSEDDYLIFDEHHYRLLRTMNHLYYLYGFDDGFGGYKKVIYHLLYETAIKLPERLLYHTAAILLSEKSLLEANATRSLRYLAQSDKYSISLEDFYGDKGESELSFLLNKIRRALIAESYSLSFYVYHELAHIKAKKDMETFTWYYKTVSDVLSSMKQFKQDKDELMDVPIEEVACDVYALDLLLALMESGTDEYGWYWMIESYICTVTNMTIMDSVLLETDPTEEHKKSCTRVVLAITTIALKSQDPSFSQEIIECMKDGLNEYETYNDEMQKAIQSLKAENGDVLERYPSFSKEWTEEKNDALSILASKDNNDASDILASIARDLFFR